MNRSIGRKTKESQMDVIVQFTFATGQDIIISWDAIAQKLKFKN